MSLGLTISVAVLTKPSAWALPPTLLLSILLLKDWKRLLSKHVWIAGAIVAVLCVPFSILTLSMVRVGMEGRSITWSRSWAAFSTYVSEFPEMLGIPLLVLALCGLVMKCFLPMYQRRPIEPFSAPFAPENYRFRFLVRALRFPPTLGCTSGLAVKTAMAPPIKRQVTLSARSTKGPHSLAR